MKRFSWVGYWVEDQCEGLGSYNFIASDEGEKMGEPKKRKIGIERDKEVDQVEALTSAVSSGLVAKKDFEIHHNEYHRKIKAGEDIADVPALYHSNLKTEGVL